MAWASHNTRPLPLEHQPSFMRAWLTSYGISVPERPLSVDSATSQATSHARLDPCAGAHLIGKQRAKEAGVGEASTTPPV